MPAYNFQKQFVPLILDKTKPHTIRHKRKRPTKVGDMLMLFTGMRTKQCKLIAISECVKVLDIEIHSGHQILLDKHWLTDQNVMELAHSDGFEFVTDFFGFFWDHYGLPTTDLEIIYWNIGELFMPSMGWPGGEIRLQLGGDK